MADAVAQANVPTLIGVLVHLTGDTGRWLSERYRPTRARGVGDNDTGGLPADVQDEIRDAAARAIEAWSQGVPPALGDPAPDLIVEVLRFIIGDAIPDDYGPMVAAELRAATGTATGASTGTATTPTLPARSDAPPLDAVVVGSGMSGIAASVELARAGVEHVVLERHDTVGGTWLENRYPGCGVDVPSHLYSYSFAPNDWAAYFSLRDEIQAYFERVATELGVRARTRFGTRLDRAVWSEERRRWQLELTGPDGRARWRRRC